MEKFLLIFCVVTSLTVVQGLVTKQKGAEILVKDFIDALIQQHNTDYSNRNIYTVVSEEIANVGDDGDKDVFINGIRSFVKAKRLRHAELGIVKRSSGMEDLHARGVNTTTPAAVTPPQTPPTTTAAAAAKATAAPTINIPKIDLCKWFLFKCKGGSNKGWFFSG